LNALLGAFGIDSADRAVLAVGDEAGLEGPAGRGAAGVELLVPGAPIPAEVEDRTYDLAVVGDVLYRLSPSVVHDLFRWVRDHLRPGGDCLVETRTFFDPDGAGLGSQLRTPYAHLAFARDVIEEYYGERGWPAPPPSNAMCRATYCVLFRRAGLSIAEIQTDFGRPEQFEEKLQWYDPDELAVARFRAWLKRPADVSEALSELHAVLKQP
jgi:hypothetical protein